MQPARLDLRIDKGATFGAVLRVMQPSLIYKAITAIAATAPVQLTVAHGLPTDWPVWVEQVQQLPALNRAPQRTTPHMARVIDASTLEINTINAAGTNAKGGQLVYQAPLDLTGATAVLQLLEDGAEADTLPVTVNAGGWLDIALTAAQTAALDWTDREYAVDVTLTSGEVLRAFAGTASVVPAGVTAGQVCQGYAVTGGDRGPAGLGITGATVDGNGHLILTLEDGTELDAGVIDRPWGSIMGDITLQLDLMGQLGLKVDQATYDAFVLGVNAALNDRYTKSESDGRYDASGAASGAVGAHEAAPDPHPQYTTAAEAAAAAPVQTVQGRTGDVAVTAADLNLQNVDNTSDDEKPLSIAAIAALALKLDTTLKGQANGLADLDNNGKVPLSQINDAVLGQMSYQGLWDASSNTPTLPSAPANQGDYYVTSAPGTQFGLTFATGDWLVANGAAWGKVDNTDAVSTVQGRTGNVVITKADLDIEETYTLAEKNKLAGVQAGAQVNVATNLAQGTRTATAVPITSSTGSAATLSAATTTLAGVMTAASLTKLNGIAAGATANAPNAELRDRATHTGTQAATTVTVADAGGYFDGGTVEAALQEVGAMIGDIGAALDAINGEAI